MKDCKCENPNDQGYRDTLFEGECSCGGKISERKDFTLKFEIAACKDCDKADVWCDYHTRKIVRLGLREQ